MLNIIYHPGGVVCALGSNPTYYDFAHDGRILNLSPGRSSLDMDLLLLKQNERLLRENAVIIISIVPFYSISGDAYSTMRIEDLYKIYRVLNRGLRKGFGKEVKTYAKRALFRKIVKKLGLTERDNSTICQFEKTNYEHDAQMFMLGWKDEFSISDFEAPLTDANMKRREVSMKHMRQLLEYCKYKSYRPVFVIMPMSKTLSSRFSDGFKETYIFSFIRPFLEEEKIPLVDYFHDKRFQDDRFYSNTLFMNNQGSSFFTDSILQYCKGVR